MLEGVWGTGYGGALEEDSGDGAGEGAAAAGDRGAGADGDVGDGPERGAELVDVHLRRRGRSPPPPLAGVGIRPHKSFGIRRARDNT